MTGPLIHKRVTSSRLCESFDYQLCRASSINNTTKPNGEWKSETKCHWKFVTCEACLFMRLEKLRSKKK